MNFTYLLRRLLQAAGLLAGVVVLTFLLTRALPGGPGTLLARNSRMTEAQRAAVLRNLGLDQPVPVQLGRWAASLLRGDLGTSYSQQRPVLDVIAERVGPTLRLMGVAFALALLLSFGSAFVSALGPDAWADRLLFVINALSLTAPVFWIGLMLQLIFAVQLGWLPSADMTRELGWLDDLRHLPLPAVTLAFGVIAGWSRYLRGVLIETLDSDYLRTARAKGLGRARALLKHALANAVVPFATIVMIDAPFFLTGSVVTETIFSWPGLGRLFFDALRSRDYPVVLGLTVYASALIVLFGILSDLVCAALDPRIGRALDA